MAHGHAATDSGEFREDAHLVVVQFGQACVFYEHCDTFGTACVTLVRFDFAGEPTLAYHAFQQRLPCSCGRAKLREFQCIAAFQRVEYGVFAVLFFR